MPKTPASRSTADLIRILDERRASQPQSSAFTLDDLSTMALLDSVGETYEIVQARFTGALPAKHAIGVREATTILGALQDVISEVGAAIRDDSPKRGPLPSSILSETALQLSPQVSPGSVIFALTPSRDEALFGESTLLSDVLEEVFNLFDQVERPASTGGTPETVSEALRTFGPRTARHLIRFAGALRENDLNLDVGTARSGSRPSGSRITSAGAGFLQRLAESASTRVTEVELVGEVDRLGRNNRYRILTAELGPITVDGTDAVTDILQVAFRHFPVRLDVTQTETLNLATGAINYTFKATAAAPVEEPAVGAFSLESPLQNAEARETGQFILERDHALSNFGFRLMDDLREEDLDAAFRRIDPLELEQLGDEEP